LAFACCVLSQDDFARAELAALAVRSRDLGAARKDDDPLPPRSGMNAPVGSVLGLLNKQ
jgi:hypothetical protein